jgi:putative aldouronate transport system substrate-binding protein
MALSPTSSRLLTTGILVAAVAAIGITLKIRPEIAARNPYEVPEVDWMALEDDFSEHVEFEIIIPTKTVVEDPYAFKVIEEAYNVSFNFITINPQEYTRKKPLLLANGLIPDYWSEGPAGIVTGHKHGFLMPVPRELLIKHCPSLVRMVNVMAPYLWRVGEVEGQNFIVPSLWPSSRYPRTGAWRKDWLENVGISETPSTIDTYEEALKRFTFNDPDGNGKNDTFGMSGDLSQGGGTFTEIFGAYGVMPYNWVLRNGEIAWGGIQPQAREALETLRRWYEAGYIHPDFITDIWYKEGFEKFYSGTVGYHNYITSSEFLDENNPASTINKLRILNPGADMAPTIIPAGPRGERGHRVWGAGIGGRVFGYTVAEQPIKLIRFLKITEALFHDEALFIKACIGEEGVHWEWQDGDPSLGAVNIPPYDVAKNLADEGLVPPRFVEKLTLFPAYLDEAQQRKYWPPNKAYLIDNFTPIAWGIQDVVGGDSALPSVGPTMARLKAKQMTRYAEFIIGDRDLKDWDKWVAECLREGGEDATEAVKVFYRESVALARNMELD